MEGGYYSSDEEIAWGPLTLREIKKEFVKEPRKVNRRQSDPPSCSYFTPSTTFSEENVESDKAPSSLTSTYYTPNSSVHSAEEPSSKNDLFLEKLTKVIEGEHCDAVESTSRENDTLLNILQSEKNDTFDGLENIHQTLITSPVQSYENEESVVFNSFIEEISSDDESVNVIVISDDSVTESPPLNDSCMDLVKIEEKSHCSEGNYSATEEILNVSTDLNSSINMENKDVHVDNVDTSYCNIKDTSATESELDFIPEEQNTHCNDRDKSASESELELDFIPEEQNTHCNDRDKSASEDELEFIPEDEEYSEASSCSDKENIYDLLEKCDEKDTQVAESEEKAFLNFVRKSTTKISEMTIEESADLCDKTDSTEKCEHDYRLDCPQYRVSNASELERRSDSLNFNDTLEEMEMALRQGLDYDMPGDDEPSYKSSENVTLQTPEPQKSGIPKLKKAPQKYDKFAYISSPIGDYIKKKVPNDDNFKLPLKPVKQKAPSNPPRSPLVSPNHFKNIPSPIGIYIKNSPGVCLKKNVHAKTIPTLKSPMKVDLVKENNENHFSLPETVYKPAKKVVAASQTKNIVLPSSIQKMVTEPVITKHETRIQGNVNKSGVSKKLLEENLTLVDASLLNQSGEDISFVNIKQAFIR